MYFKSFDVAKEGKKGCDDGDRLKMWRGDKKFKFCGSAYQGKLLRLDSQIQSTWLRFLFHTNANNLRGKGFEIYIFGKYNRFTEATTPEDEATPATPPEATTKPPGLGFFQNNQESVRNHTKIQIMFFSFGQTLGDYRPVKRFFC